MVASKESGSLLSVNKQPYDSCDGHYYLGYQDADFEKPFAKYYNLNPPSISDELQKGLSASPWASDLGYSASEAKGHLLLPGYQIIENGYTMLPDGTLYVAVRTEIPHVSGDAYNWWFGWHLTDTSRYKLWNPFAHQYAWRHPDSLECSNKSLPDRYINTYSFLSESIGSESSKVTVAFINPAELGIDTATFQEQNIEAMVVARIKFGEHVTSGFDGKSYLIHQVRRRPNGQRELRSRFWIAEASNQVGHDLMVHCGMEMTHLNTFLPSLYEEFKDTV
ncbi:hypothetical protein BJX96DRAFT_150636 [Aspergillus floccosus]